MSDDDNSHTLRNKTLVFTVEERKLLLLLVNQHYDVVNNKKVDSTSTQLKNHAWEAINKDYLQHHNLVRLPRTTQQLKRCWENMKCKAKKGDPMSVKLLKWGESQYRLHKSGVILDQIGNGNALDPLIDDNIECSSLEDKSIYDEDQNHLDKLNNEPHDEREKVSEMLEETVPVTNDKFKINSCLHCSCLKKERAAKMDVINLEKQQSKEIHLLKLQLHKDRIKREKELHKLVVHELTLKIENERRRAEILEKELGNT